MMGFGSSHGQGGFAASSSLSPLAPPFTVDHRFTSRRTLNINAPPYGAPDTFPHLNLGHAQAPHTPPAYEPSPASQPASSNSTVYLSSPPAEPQVDNTFSQFPSTSLNNDFGDGHYYVPPSTWDETSLVTHKELGYKFSTTTNGVGTTQDNYTQSLSGLQYPSLLGHFSDGPLVQKSGGGKTSFPDKFAPEAPNFTYSSTYTNYINEGCEPPTVLGKTPGESFVPQIKYIVDIGNPAGFSGSNAVVEKPLSEFHATEPFVASISALPPKTCGFSCIPVADGSVIDSWDSPIPICTTNGTIHKQRPLNDSSTALTSFSAITIKPPSTGSSSSLGIPLPPQQTMKPGGNGPSGNSDAIDYDLMRDVQDPWGCLSKRGQESKKYSNSNTGSIDSQRYDSNSLLFSTKYVEPSSLMSVTNSGVHVSKHNSVNDVHGSIHNMEGFSLLMDESDQYNPSEDSPCWKGSTSYFSQSPLPEAVPSQYHTKSLNSFDSSNVNQPQTFSFNDKDPTTVSSPDFHEKTMPISHGKIDEDDALLSSIEWGYAGKYLYDEANDLSFTNNVLCAFERSSNGRSFPSDNPSFNKADAVDIKSVGAKKHESSNPIRLCLETLCCGSNKETGSVACMPETDVNSNVAPEDCYLPVPSDTTKPVSSSLSSDSNICSDSKRNQENWAGYGPELKPLLLKTIVDLSDLLLFFSLNDEAPVKNEDQKTLELVVGKLSICLENAQVKSGAKASSINKQGRSSIIDEAQVYQHASADGPPLVKNVKSHEDNCPDLVTGSKTTGLQKLAWEDSRGKANSMTKAIKEILDANFDEDAEMQPLASVYKNLWLEAEAALCSTNYKARFHHMKMEMEKSRSDEKEKSLGCEGSVSGLEVFQESTTMKTVHTADVLEQFNNLKCGVESCDREVVDELDNSKISSYQREVDRLSTRATDFIAAETSIKDSNIETQSLKGPSTNGAGQQSSICLSNTHGADKVEDPIKARLQILKNRADYPRYIESEQQPFEVSRGFVGKANNLSVGNGEPSAFDTERTKATVAISEDVVAGIEPVSVPQPSCKMRSPNTEIAGLGAQFSGGWFENNSSDWEHVMEDEFAWKAGAINL
uniref:Uncharacterized protein n=1 Tax=Kalanchoe fedtschenkoi TaxID=63787 RepID=A0A7N0TJ54_KALFE